MVHLAASNATVPWICTEIAPLVVNASGFTVPSADGWLVHVQTLWTPASETRNLVQNFGARRRFAAIIAA